MQHADVFLFLFYFLLPNVQTSKAVVIEMIFHRPLNLKSMCVCSCNSKDSGSSLLGSMALPTSSPSPSYSETKPSGSSLLNGPHTYTQAADAIKVTHTHTHTLI